MKALLMTLQGPLRSWGGMSVGDDRNTLDTPTLSAVLGLVGACLGVERQDDEALDWLYNAFDMMSATALGVGHPGTNKKRLSHSIRSDFHTAQGSRQVNGEPCKGTVIGIREYIEDTIDAVALIPRRELDEGILAAVEHAMFNPVFTPYLGRRCNPFSAPPVLPGDGFVDVQAHEVADALIDRLRRAASEKKGLHGYSPDEQDKGLDLLEALIVAPAGALEGWQGGTKGYAKSLPDRRTGKLLAYSQRPIDTYFWHTDGQRGEEP